MNKNQGQSACWEDSPVNKVLKWPRKITVLDTQRNELKFQVF